MGVTIRCKKTGNDIDLGYGGFNNLREKVAELAGKEFGEHYAELSTPRAMFSMEPDRKEYFKSYNAKTAEMVKAKKVNVKIANFCYQSDCDGNIHYGACKAILKAIGDYDDNILYGYSGRSDCAKFKDFKSILQDCVETKSDMTWS